MSGHLGTVFIKDGKIEQIDIKDEAGKPLSEIEQILALRDMVDEHIKYYEKNTKRT